MARERLATIQQRAESSKLISQSPSEFIRERLGIATWYRQEELIESVWQNTITGCVSGQKTGKTLSAAGIAIAWCKLNPRGLVRLASASEDQLINGLWGEIRSILIRHPDVGPFPNLAPSTGWRASPTQSIVGVSAKEANRIAGYSGPEQLWIVDEACGIDYALWEVILGNLMGGGHLLWLTNPVTIGGKVYDWDTNPDSSANVIRIDARETPNFPGTRDYVEGRTVPGLATPEGVETIRKDYGEDSAEFDVRVRGRFPRAGSNVVIPLNLVEDGIARWRNAPDVGPLVLGVDVARFGDDDSCIAPRRDKKILTPETVHGLDTVQVAEKVVEVARRERRHNEKVTAVVEVNGVGAGVVDTLNAWVNDHDRRLDWIRIVPFDSGAKAEDEEKYFNRRSELWFGGQEFIKDGGALPELQRLKGELIAPTYGFDSRGRRKVESKDEIKKKTKRSPDMADAVLLSISSIQAGQFSAEDRIDEPESRWHGFE
jgi:phage terminase large subunit